MRQTITPFDVRRHHIHIPFSLMKANGEYENFFGILDTGAPRTEFSDLYLAHAGFIKSDNPFIQIKAGMQTQKYGKTILSSLQVLGHEINEMEVFVSRFERDWGIAALIGLDFFKKFRVTIDYQKGQLVTEAY